MQQFACPQEAPQICISEHAPISIRVSCTVTLRSAMLHIQQCYTVGALVSCFPFIPLNKHCLPWQILHSDVTHQGFLCHDHSYICSPATRSAVDSEHVKAAKERTLDADVGKGTPYRVGQGICRVSAWTDHVDKAACKIGSGQENPESLELSAVPTSNSKQVIDSCFNLTRYEVRTAISLRSLQVFFLITVPFHFNVQWCSMFYVYKKFLSTWRSCIPTIANSGNSNTLQR